MYPVTVTDAALQHLSISPSLYPHIPPLYKKPLVGLTEKSIEPVSATFLTTP
jgi:hypothetical protein